MKLPLRSSLLGLTTAETLKRFGFWLVIAGLIGEAATIIFVASGTREKTLSVIFTLAIALGIWLEEVGADAIETREKAKADLILAELTAQAAKAMREAEKIKANASWRTLSSEQRVSLKLALDANGPPGSVQFTLLVNDPESLYFAQQFSIPFKAAGWRVAYRFESYATGMAFGIMVPEARDNWLDEMKDVNRSVRESLIAANILFVNGWPQPPHMWVESEGLPAPIAWVYIGPKPMPSP